jgi:sugar/nucleoside kinase (ribokinase family)
MKDYDVLVYGPIFCDLIFTGLPGMPCLGKELFADQLTVSLGGSAIVTAGLKRLGMKVGLITNLGTDRFSLILWELLEEYDIDRTLITKNSSSLKRVTVGLSYPEDRAFITRFESLEDQIDLNKTFKENSTRHVHICSFLATLRHSDIVKIAHDANATVSADFGWDEAVLIDSKLKNMLNKIDYFLPSKSEICQMTQVKDITSAAEKFLSEIECSCLVIKDGDNGAFGYTSNEKIHVPAIPINPVETTGAGDAFDAGFLFGCLQKKPFKTCMEYGVICGGLTTTVPGGTEGFPTLEEIKLWL